VPVSICGATKRRRLKTDKWGESQCSLNKNGGLGGKFINGNPNKKLEGEKALSHKWGGEGGGQGGKLGSAADDVVLSHQEKPWDDFPSKSKGSLSLGERDEVRQLISYSASKAPNQGGKA